VTKKALDTSQAAGTTSKLDAMAAHTQAVMSGQATAVMIPPVPFFIKKKHDVINFFLGQGLKGQAVVEAMASKGFKIKLADVNANIKWYGTEKIPAAFPKAGMISPVVPVGVPKPVPAPVVQPLPNTAASSLHAEEFIMDKQVGPQKGSNPGGLYEDKDGTKRYVKLYAEEGQGIGEKISNEIYRRLGHTAPESILFTRTNGKLGFASKIIENEGTLEKVGLTKERALKVLDGFAADVLTANWDAVGLALDNIVVLKGGGIARIDQGGSLLFRAKGALKPSQVLGSIGEWDTFASTTNPAYKKIFQAAEISKIEELGDKLIKQIEDIKKLRDSLGVKGWRGLIDSLGVPASLAQSAKLAQVLESRANLLIKKAETIKQIAAQAEEMKKLMEQASANGLVYKKLEYKDVGILPVPPGTIQIGNYGHAVIVSKPPLEIINAGGDAIAKWYGKHLAQATVDDVVNAVAKLGKYTGGFANVEALMLEGATGKALSAVTPVKPGFVGDHNATQLLDKKHGELKTKLAASHINALKSYGGSGYGAINEALRKGESPFQSNPAGRIRALDNAMKTTTLDANVVLYRGLGQQHPLNNMSLTELQKAIGSEFTELAYGSHSTDIARAMGFSSRHRAIRVHAPHTTHGVWMRGAGAGVHSEQEFLMHRSSRFKIVGISGSGGQIIIDVELIAQDAVALKAIATKITDLTLHQKEQALVDKFGKPKLQTQWMDGPQQTYDEFIEKKFAKLQLEKEKLDADLDGVSLTQKEKALTEDGGSVAELKEHWQLEVKDAGVSYQDWINEQYDSYLGIDV